MAPQASVKRHPLKSVLAGGIAGGIEVSLMFPTEFVKTLMQLDSKAGIARLYKGPIHCAQMTVADHGVKGLYRGLSSLVYGSIPKSAVRFTVFDTLKSALSDDTGTLSRKRTLIAGLGAGVAEAVCIVTPMESVKVKLIHDQIQAKPRFRSGIGGVIDVMRIEGWKGCYRGLLPTIAKQGSNQAIRFFVYGELKAALQAGDPSLELGTLQIAMCGALAGAASVFGNTPIDVVKSRMQGLDATKYKGVIDCVRQIARAEGIQGFYKGTVPRLGRVCGDVAIVFTLYELVNKALDTIWDTSDYGR